MAHRNPWYALSPPLRTRVFINKGINDRHFAVVMDKPTACDQQIYQVKAHSEGHEALIGILLNSTITALFAELIGRRNFGEGVLWLATYEVAQFPILDLRLIGDSDRAFIQRAFAGMSSRRPLPIKDEVTQCDRRALDEIIGRLLGLSSLELNAAYASVVSLVEERLSKASSLKARKGSTMEESPQEDD